MRCECLITAKKKGAPILRCQNEATLRLTMPCFKPRFLSCDTCGEARLEWAAPYRKTPGRVVVERVTM